MTASRTVTVVGQSITTLEIEVMPLATSSMPRPGMAGAGPVPEFPPRGLLRSAQCWQTLTRSMIIDIREREGRFGDQEWMDLPVLRGLRLLYVGNWRDSINAQGQASERAVYWAMRIERVDELVEFLQSPLGDIIRRMRLLLRRTGMDDRDRYFQLGDLLAEFSQALHVLSQRKYLEDPGDSFRIDQRPEVAETWIPANTELLRLWIALTEALIGRWRASIERMLAGRPADDVFQRRQQRAAFAAVLYGDAKASSAKSADGLPASLRDVVSGRLSIERQRQLLGTLRVDEDQEPVLLRAADRLVEQAVELVKSARVRWAEVDVADARRRVAMYPGMAARERRLTPDELKSRVLVVEICQEITRDVLGNERGRQLLGGGDGGGKMMGMELGLGVKDVSLYRLMQEAQRIVGSLTNASTVPLEFAEYEDLIDRDDKQTRN